MLLAKNLYFSYNDTPLIEGFSLEVEKANKIAIIGKNGYGKSTLLRLLANEMQPLKGTLKHKENLKIGYFGQTNISSLNSNNTIEEEIQSANPELKYSEIKAIAGQMMFSQDLAKKKISVISGGEKSRVLLAKILANPCNLLLLDEPTHHLDTESIEALIDAINNFSYSTIIVTHSEYILKKLSLDKIIICEKAKQKEFLGSYEEFLSQIGWNENEEQEKITNKKNNTKELKHQKALFITKKNKILKPLKEKIKLLEQKISKLEKEQKENLDSLQNNQINSELIKKTGLNQKYIDSLYEELDSFYLEYDEKENILNNEFTESLNN